MLQGSGNHRCRERSFAVAARFPSLRGEPPGTTTPEELLAASHAVCYGIGLRSVIGRGGGSASRVVVTAEKGPAGIRVRRSHLSAVAVGVEGIDESALAEITYDIASA